MAGRPKKRIAELLSKDDPLCVLLSLISDKESFVAISRYEALKWAPVKFEALLHSELLKEVPPIRAVRCDKCEYFCSEVPVVKRGGRYWIICQQREDTGRIPVSDEQMRGYQFSVESVKDYLYKLLDCKPYFAGPKEETNKQQEVIGIVHSGKLRLTVQLLYQNFYWLLKIGENTLEVKDVIGFDGHSYVLQSAQKQYLLCADKSDESRDRRRARLLATVDYYKQIGISPIYETIAKEEGVSLYAIKNELKEARKDRTILKLKETYLKELRERHFGLSE